MSDKSGVSPDIISLPEGGGAVSGLGETFSPDLFTGTGNFSVPIALPPGRNKLQPELVLRYSTGQGNSPFGLGWALGVPGVRRKTDRGVPTFDDDEDVFVLSGAEDLVRVNSPDADVTRYRPRTEGLFARVEHHHGAEGNFWKVWTRNGNISFYGTAPDRVDGSASEDPAVIRDPDSPSRILGWNLSETRDRFGNHIRYDYLRDDHEEAERSWTQVYLSRVRYVDYGSATDPDYLVSVEFNYEERSDAFSSFRGGFELRTRLRCASVDIVSTESTGAQITKTYSLEYASQSALHNGVSVLHRVQVQGFDGALVEELPPLEFTYNDFEPELRKFRQVGGSYLPSESLGSATLTTVDLFGNGLPDLVELNGRFARYWRNIGGGTFAPPQSMPESPQGLGLDDPGVRFLDAEGNGRADLLVSRPGQFGYFPLRFDGTWDGRSFRSYRVAPPVALSDQRVRLMDLDGDGLTDVLFAGDSLISYFNDADPDRAWTRSVRMPRQAATSFPDVDFSDPRVFTADMTGDGLQDLVRVFVGRVDYWPNRGHGQFGSRVTMANAPALPWQYSPDRILVGDVDGDGCADLILVEDQRVTLWMNQSGNGYSAPIVIRGTPAVSDRDAVLLLDLEGSGVSGLLWSRAQGPVGRPEMFFLDFTGGQKPYLLTEMNNHMGAVTRVGYEPSTAHYLRDQAVPDTRWSTPLPFPVQTVTRVEVIDQVSNTKLSTEYSYKFGYWDGYEREFRGFGEVDQRDTESFQTFNEEGYFPGESFLQVDESEFVPPMETRHWFHLGPVHNPQGGWMVPDMSARYWVPAGGDASLLNPWSTHEDVISSLPIEQQRDALRTLRGSTLRTELYALDGTELEDRPYVVSESLQSFRKEGEGQCGNRVRAIFFPFSVASCVTHWDRGEDPATTFEFVWNYDAYGQPVNTLSVACPRNWSATAEIIDPADPFLSMYGETSYIHTVDDQNWMVDRVATSSSSEVRQNEAVTLVDLVDVVQTGVSPTNSDVSLELQSLQRVYYDGPEFEGLPLGAVGEFGAATRTERLVLTSSILSAAYPDGVPEWLTQDVVSSGGPDAFLQRLNGLPGRVGYVVETVGDEVHYFSSSSMKYDFQDASVGNAKGLLLASRDPLGNETSMFWDDYSLFPVEVVDALGMSTTARYDYRVFQADRVTDLNQNRTEVLFTPLGLTAALARTGKEGENQGDTLQTPGVRFEYDLEAFDVRGEPLSVMTKTRVYHANDTDVPAWADPDEELWSVEYSDGFGRVIQARAQAEAFDYGDVGLGRGGANDAIGTSSGTRVRVSGWQRYNNKGEVVEKWEPFFSEGFAFQPILASPPGQSVRFFFDVRGRNVTTLHPNGAQERVVYGVPVALDQPEDFVPTPWEAYTYDANDNGARSTILSVDTTEFQSHWDTPSSARVDALGRTVETVERNGTSSADWQVTKMTYDIRGNLLTVTDPLDRVAAQQIYDLADQPLRTESIDAGVSTVSFDAAGSPLESRNSRGARELSVVDALLRPTLVWGQDSATESLRLVQRITYGDQAGLAEPEALNVVGMPFEHRDEAGKLTFSEYDFSGNLLAKVRQVIDPSHLVDAYQAADAGSSYEIDTFRLDWTPQAGQSMGDKDAELLSNFDYQVDTAYDALGRPKRIQYPEDVTGARKVLVPRFNRAGALERVDLDGTFYVDEIAYNARGQRTLIAYGNGVMTRYAYNTTSFRLQQMRSEPYEFSAPRGERRYSVGRGAKLQDLHYAYDAVGNIQSIESRGTGLGIEPGDFAYLAEATWGNFSADSLLRRFEYDPLYRLTRATGRERKGVEPIFWGNQVPGGSSVEEARPYIEHYSYDKTGGMVEKRHEYALDAANGVAQWKRTYQTDASSNRLVAMGLGGESRGYVWDGGGNLVQENSERHYEWDHAGRLRAFRVQAAGSPTSSYGAYGYDGVGQRVQKVSIRGGVAHATVYIDGIFEHHQILDGTSAPAQANELHVMDDASRVASRRVGPDIFNAQKPAVLYELGDHLGSSSVVVSETGGLISREEYRPYGESSFGSYAKKRFRFTGKERDEESGLYYHGARYYSPWLCRWTAPDPAGMVDGVNVYAYVRGNPVRLVDPGGMQAGPWDGAQLGATTEEYTPKNAVPLDHISNAESEGESLAHQVQHESMNLFDDGVRTSARRAQIWEFTLSLRDETESGDITSVEAMARVAEFIAPFHINEQGGQDKRAFVNDFISVLSDATGRSGHFFNTREENRFIGLGQSGMRAEYQEPQWPKSNQTRHFSGWVAAGHYWGRIASTVGLILSESHGPTATWEDYVLGQRAVSLGIQLQHLALPKQRLNLQDVGDWIRINVGEPSDYPNISEERVSELNSTEDRGWDLFQ